MIDAAEAAGILALTMSEFSPKLETGPKASRRACSPAVVAAGQLCALLESLGRMRMYAGQCCNATQAEESITCGSSDPNSACPQDGSRPEPNSISPTAMPWWWHRISSCVGLQLVDVIMDHSRPSSKPCRQLCSLLATMLKATLHHSS